VSFQVDQPHVVLGFDQMLFDQRTNSHIMKRKTDLCPKTKIFIGFKKVMTNLFSFGIVQDHKIILFTDFESTIIGFHATPTRSLNVEYVIFQQSILETAEDSRVGRSLPKERTDG
jgi:hypothetical protein